ncbi:MAG: HgcAB-like fusion protein [Candidatus Odinarchaeota archaeon]
MKIKKPIKLFLSFFLRWTGFPIEPTLIKVGNPTNESPVFLTCNFILTVKRVLKAIKDLDCYLLIAPSRGINAWCGACGDDFNTDSVLSIMKTSGIDLLVSHRTLILPQLSAPGMDPLIIKKKTGWDVKFGPVYAKDIPSFINQNFNKSEVQRTIRFPISNRIEMATLYFFILALLTSAIYWISAIFLPILNVILYLDTILIFIILIYGPLLILPSIPTKTGKVKVWIYEGIVLLLIVIFNLVIAFNLLYLIWNIVSSLLITFIMAEDFHGLTPIYKSELGAKTWKKGNEKMRFLFGEYKLQPYGQIIIEKDKCIGCKVCIEICPKNLYLFNEEDKKVDLRNPENCINCNACVKRCLAQCLEIK